MPETYTLVCPECRKTLTSRRPVPAGTVVTCPKCDVMFAAPKPRPARDDVVEDDVEVVEDDVEVVEDDVEVVESTPSRRAKPATRKPAVNEGIEVVDDAEPARPRRKPAPAFRKKSGNSGLVIGLASALGVLALAGIGILAWWILGGPGDEPLAYVPSDSGIVGGVDLHGILNSPMATSVGALLGTPAMPFGRLVNATGAPMRDGLDRAVFVFGDGAGATMIVKTAVPIDTGKVSQVFQGATASKVGGQTAFRLNPPGPKLLVVPNKQIAIFSDASEDQLSRIARSSGKTSALSGDLGALAAKFTGNTIWAVVGPQALSSPAFQGGMQGAIAGNPAAKALGSKLQSTKGLGFSMNLSGNDVDIRIGMLFPDDAAAQSASAELQALNDSSKKDPLSKAMMLAAPAWAKALQSEAEATTKVQTEGPMALMSMRLSLGTLQKALEALSAMMPAAGGAAPGADGGAAPLMIPKNRPRPGG